MPRQEALDLTRRVLKHFENDTLDIADEVWREPRGAYIGHDRFEADLRMLRSVPHVIGWAGEVATPGCYTTKDVMGVPVLVARGKDGVLRAFINGCAHRGAQVAEHCGRTRMFSCPYHGWTYGLDGRLTGTPARKMFDGQDFPMAAACQRGLEAGVDHVVFGRNEALLQHLSLVRRQSLADSAAAR